jgi:hypothetical protein
MRTLTGPSHPISLARTNDHPPRRWQSDDYNIHVGCKPSHTPNTASGCPTQQRVNAVPGCLPPHGRSRGRVRRCAAVDHPWGHVAVVTGRGLEGLTSAASSRLLPSDGEGNELGRRATARLDHPEALVARR